MTNGVGGDVGGVESELLLKKKLVWGVARWGGSKEKPKRNLVTAPETDKLSKRNGVWECFVAGEGIH